MKRCAKSSSGKWLRDLWRDRLPADARELVEAHLATCDECREDVEVLRTVKTAAVFAPQIDVDRVVRQIPPYRAIVPPTERPATTRVVSWLVASAVAAVVIWGGPRRLLRPDAGKFPWPVPTTAAPP